MRDERSIAEMLLREVDAPKDFDGQYAISPNDKRIAYVAPVPVVSPENRPRWGSDAAIGHNGKHQWTVVVDGIEQGHYDEIGLGSIQFSLDSQRIAYIAESDRYSRPLMDGGSVRAKARLVIDGEDGKQCDEIDYHSFCFSPDSKRTAYVALEGNEHVLVIDGNEVDMTSISERRTMRPRIKEAFFSAHYESVGGGLLWDNTSIAKKIAPDPVIFFSPNSQRVAYVVESGRFRG